MFKVQFSTAALILMMILPIGCNRTKGNEQLIRNDKVVIITGEYKGWACGGLTPQIFPVEGLPTDISIEKIKYGFEFWIPSGTTAPDQIDEVCVPGNRFKLKGFFYYKLKNDKMYVVPRFDLLEWQLLSPAKRWNQEDSGNPILLTPNEYNDFSSSSTRKENLTFKVAGKYDSGCL